jgi:hypothetical protein
MQPFGHPARPCAVTARPQVSEPEVKELYNRIVRQRWEEPPEERERPELVEPKKPPVVTSSLALIPTNFPDTPDEDARTTFFV